MNEIIQSKENRNMEERTEAINSYKAETKDAEEESENKHDRMQ